MPDATIKTESVELSSGQTYQRGDNGELTPTPASAKTATIRRDPAKEYIAGQAYNLIGAYLQALPTAIDDVTRDFGDDLYDRMLLDGQVGSDVETLISAALAHPLTFRPDMQQYDTDQKTGERTEVKDWALAQEIADFCGRALSTRMVNPHTGQAQDTDFGEAVRDMATAFAFGNRIGEKTAYPIVAGKDAGKVGLRCKVRPRRNTAFIVDIYFNVLGVAALIPGTASTNLVLSHYASPKDIPNLLPRWKIAVMTWRKKDSDPRGQSGLRKAYDAWFVKQQIKGMRLAYLARFAGGFIVGNTAENAVAETAYNPDGTVMKNEMGYEITVSPVQALLTALQEMQAGACIALPFGAKAEPFFPPEQNPFDDALDTQNREISTAILGQTRMGQEAQHGSKADSETGQDVFGLRVREMQQAILRMIATDFVPDLVYYNWGESAMHLCPTASLSETEAQDKADLINAFAAAKWEVAPSQYQGVDAMIGAPIRSQQDVDMAMKAAQMAANPPEPPAAIPGKPGDKPQDNQSGDKAKFSDDEDEHGGLLAWVKALWKGQNHGR